MSASSQKTLKGIKRGGTFAVYLNFALIGNALPVGTADVTASVRDQAGRVVEKLQVNQTSTPGRLELRSVDTSQWPLGDLVFDVRWSYEGDVLYTDTVVVPVWRSQT